MDTKELDRIYTELQKRCDAGHLTKHQIDNITKRFNVAYNSYVEFRRISCMTPIYTKELKFICTCFSDLRRKALEKAI